MKKLPFLADTPEQGGTVQQAPVQTQGAPAPAPAGVVIPAGWGAAIDAPAPVQQEQPVAQPAASNIPAGWGAAGVELPAAATDAGAEQRAAIQEKISAPPEEPEQEIPAHLRALEAFGPVIQSQLTGTASAADEKGHAFTASVAAQDEDGPLPAEKPAPELPAQPAKSGRGKKAVATEVAQSVQAPEVIPTDYVVPAGTLRINIRIDGMDHSQMAALFDTLAASLRR